MYTPHVGQISLIQHVISAVIKERLCILWCMDYDCEQTTPILLHRQYTQKTEQLYLYSHIRTCTFIYL